MDDTGRARWSRRRIAVIASVLLVIALVVAGQVFDDHVTQVQSITLSAAIAVSFTAMAAFVLAGIPGHLVGRLMAAAGVISGGMAVAASWSSWLPLAWLSQWTWWPPLALIVLTLLVFPDGRLPSPRWRPLAILIVAAASVVTFALAAAALDHPYDLVTTTDRVLTGRAHGLVRVARVAALVIGAGLIGVLASLWVRWRRAGGEVRGQLMCLLAAVPVFALALVLDALGVPGAFLLAAVAVPVAMTVAVLRFRLYGLDLALNRTVVWLIMSVLVIAGFAAVVALIRAAVTVDCTSASLAATGLVVAGFEPVHRRVQSGVNRLLYGERDDPYEVISRLGRVLGQTPDPAAVLPSMTRTIARSLQVPYVGVELQESDGPRLFAESGEMATRTEAFPMVTRGERVGRLLVATRDVGARFTRHECRLLEGVAQHAAVAVEATRLFRDLDDSRDRLIRAQERERARLSRDLHDGVGSALTGMAMQVRAAQKSAHDPDWVTKILGKLAVDLKNCRSELRQIVDDLNPRALAGGLAAALRAECRRFTGPDLEISLDLAENLDGLPTTTQVAAYWIVTEALNNVVQHARARTCEVRVRRGRSLIVDIVDDGVGITAARPGSVGLASMRERAEELGGACRVATVEPHGTVVTVRLPIASTA